MLKVDTGMQAYLVGVKLLVRKYCLLIAHLSQSLCRLYKLQ